MSKEKLKLDDLKVQSFVTTLGDDHLEQVKGGILTIKGREFSYRVRWTTVDTRTNTDNAPSSNHNPRNKGSH